MEDHPAICLSHRFKRPILTFIAVGQSKFKVVYHENDSTFTLVLKGFNGDNNDDRKLGLVNLASGTFPFLLVIEIGLL